MSAPYSYDFRRKAIEAIKRGHKKVNVCRLFKISRNTLDLWLKREKETGDFRAIANKQGRHSKIEDEETFIDEDENIERFDVEVPPNLKFSRVQKFKIGDSTLLKPNWNKIVRYIHCLCMKQAQTFDALQIITTFNIRAGKYEEEGFDYVSEIDISIQKVDAKTAFKGILAISKKLSIPFSIYFQWLDKPEAENPGGKGLLSWSPD